MQLIKAVIIDLQKYGKSQYAGDFLYVRTQQCKHFLHSSNEKSMAQIWRVWELQGIIIFTERTPTESSRNAFIMRTYIWLNYWKGRKEAFENMSSIHFFVVIFQLYRFEENQYTGLVFNLCIYFNHRFQRLKKVIFHHFSDSI